MQLFVTVISDRVNIELRTMEVVMSLFLILFIFTLGLPLMLVLRIFTPIILVPTLIVGSFSYLTIKLVSEFSILYGRLQTYRKALSISTIKGYIGAGLRGRFENLSFIHQNISHINLSRISFSILSLLILI
jgi:ABC-type multidrug transport system fused ATPase/permease subunit